MCQPLTAESHSSEQDFKENYDIMDTCHTCHTDEVSSSPTVLCLEKHTNNFHYTCVKNPHFLYPVNKFYYCPSHNSSSENVLFYLTNITKHLLLNLCFFSVIASHNAK